MKTLIIPGHDSSTPEGRVIDEIIELIKTKREDIIILPRNIDEALEQIQSISEKKIVLELRMSLSEKSDIVFTYPVTTSRVYLDKALSEILQRKLYFNRPIEQVRNLNYMLNMGCDVIRFEMYRLFMPRENEFILSDRGKEVVSNYFVSLIDFWL